MLNGMLMGKIQKSNKKMNNSNRTKNHGWDCNHGLNLQGCFKSMLPVPQLQLLGWKITEKEKPPIVVAGSPWSPWELTEDTVTRSESATALKATCRWSYSARSRSLGVVLRWGSRWDLFSSQWMAPDLHCSRWYGRILLYNWSASWWGLLSYTFIITY